MNYSEALSFSFRDDEWLKKIGIGGLINFISFYVGLFFITGFFMIGYYVGIIRNIKNDKEPVLPDWSENLGKLFVDGLMGAIIILIYFLVIGGMCALIITNIWMESYARETEQIMATILVSILTLLSLSIFINYGLLQFAITENFAAAFSVKGFIHLLRTNLGNFIAIIIFSTILNAILFLAGLGLLSPFTNFWGMVVQAHLFGQCLKRHNSTNAVVQPAS